VQSACSIAASTEAVVDVNGRTLGGLLPVGPTTATTKVEVDIDGGTLGGAAGRSDGSHHRS
jgi:hypothetical protein